MELQTALVLAIQLIALFSIAGALLLYLLCKISGTEGYGGPQMGSILITSADTALGLQLSTFLAGRGLRVFAGMKDPVDSLPAKLLRSWVKERESMPEPMSGTIVPMKIDVTREDILREATESMGAHMSANERGLLAVINNAGSVHKGRIDLQDSAQWENMFKNNVMGCLRTARAFIGLLRPTRGRLIFLGSGNAADGLVAFAASRNAVEGCADALREELKPYGVSVITLDSHGMSTESLFRAPIPFNTTSAGDSAPTQYSAKILTTGQLNTIEKALWDVRPHKTYCIAVPTNKFQLHLPCRGSFRLSGAKPMRPADTVQTV